MPSRRIKQSLFRIFWKSDMNLIIFGGGYTFIIFFLIQRVYRIAGNVPYTYSIEALVRYMDIFCYVHFPLMFLAAVNYFTLEKRHAFDEVLDEASVRYRDRAKKAVLMRLNSFLCLLFVCMQIVYFMQMSVSSFHYLVTSVFHVLYIFGGVGILAIELGLLLAKISRRELRFLMFLVLNFLLGYPMLWLNNYFFFWWTQSFNASPVKYIFMELFNVLPEGVMTSTDGYGCHAVEVHKFFLLFSWILICYLCNTLLYRFYTKKKKILWISAIALICCMISFLPYGKIDGTGQRTYNKYYAKYEKSANRIQGQETLEAQEFHVISYSIEFYTFINLYAKVEAKVSEPDLDTYCFTLLDEYRVLSVKNQDGTRLDFERKGDYLYVYAGDGATDSMTFQYYGMADPLYADFNGIYLPAGVPFFPMPGINDVYVKANDESGNIYYYENHLPETEFKVTVHTLGEVYSSLEEEGENQFYGKSDGFFLLSGTVFTNEVDGVTFYYPVTTYEYAPVTEIEEVQKSFIEDMDDLLTDYGEAPLKGKKVLVMWMTFYDDGLDVFDDFVGVHAIQSSPYSEELYQSILGDSGQ